MNEFFENLKRQAEENPVLAIGVGAGLLTSVGKLLQATSEMRNSRSWKKEVARRAMKDGLKK